MPRRARLCFPGVPMHIRQRGVDGDPCFLSDNDRLVYLGLLAETRARFGCSLHAYVLMTNHVHLLLTPQGRDGASRFMKAVGQEFAQYFNRTHGRYGPLWEGRFRSSLVDSDAYLWRCHQYVEMNPVRAGMVTTPGAYKWSSHRANAWGQASALLDPHPDYLALGEVVDARTEAYSRLFEQPLGPAELDEIRKAVDGGFAFGSDAFRERLEELAGRPASRRRHTNTRYCGGPATKADQVV